MSVNTWAKIKRNIPASDFEIQVTAKQFNWDVVYPGADGKFGTDDDVKFDNDLHVPVNKVVRVHLTSSDVIHSFFIPNLRFKQDAVPGRTILTWFEAKKPGKIRAALRRALRLWPFRHEGVAQRLHPGRLSKMGGGKVSAQAAVASLSSDLTEHHYGGF